MREENEKTILKLRENERKKQILKLGK